MKRTSSQIPLCCLAFLLGFFATIGQVIFTREILAVFYGNELFIAAVFMFWFAGIVLGALAAGRRGGRGAPSQAVLGWLVGLMPLAALGSVAGIRLLRSLCGADPGQLLSLAQGAAGVALFVFPYSFLVGLAFPWLSAHAADPDPRRETLFPAGRVYWLESGGSLAAGALFTLVLAGRLSSPTVLVLCLAAGMAAAAAGAVEGGRGPSRAVALAAIAGALLLGAVARGIPDRLDRMLVQRRWQALAPGFRLVAERDSPIENLALGEREGQYSLYLNGQLALTFPDPYEREQRVHLWLNQVPDPREVLVVGGGLEGDVQRMLDYPLSRLTLVFLDPVIPSLVLPFLEPPERRRLSDPRLALVAGDIGDYLARTPARYDLIVLNMPPPGTAGLNRFYALEFLQLCRERLRRGGVLVTGLEGAEAFIGEDVGRYTGTLYRTIQRVFPQVLAVPGTRIQFVAGGPEAKPTLNAQVLGERFARHGLRAESGFSPLNFRLLVPPERVAWLDGELRLTPPAWLNSDRQPVIYLYNLKLWDRATGSRLAGVLSALETLSFSRLLAFVGACGLFVAALTLAPRGRAGERRALGRLLVLGVFLFGAGGMGLELILLYHFQNLFGYLYSVIGLLIAGFMLGLTAGAWAMNRRTAPPDRSLWRLALVFLPAALVLLLLGAGLAYGIRWPGAFAAVLVQMVAAGLLTGAYFPLACRLYAETGPGLLATAARMDAVDHLGALAGAGVTGVLLLPLLGIERTVLLLSAGTMLLPVCFLLRSVFRRPDPPDLGKD